MWEKIDLSFVGKIKPGWMGESAGEGDNGIRQIIQRVTCVLEVINRIKV